MHIRISPFYVRRIAEFLNHPLSDEIINRIAEQCTFQGMKKNEISYKIMHGRRAEFAIVA